MKCRREWIEALEGRRLMSANHLRALATSSDSLVHVATGDSLSGGVLDNTADVGAVGSPGSFSYANGTYTLAGSGAGIGGTSDGLTFASTSTVQDIVVSARVDSLTSSAAGATAGVMIRNATGGSASTAVWLVVTGGGQLRFGYRGAANASASSTVVSSSVTAPLFVRLARSGNVVIASYSTDGQTWLTAGASTSIGFDSGASRAGLIVASGTTSQTTTATFSDVAVLGGGATWNSIGVGASGSSGSSGYDATSGTYELISSGSGISGAADDFDFAAQPLNGDGSVIARVLSTTATAATAGVMIRASTAADAPFAAMLVGNGQLSFAWRSAASAAVQRVTIGTSVATTPTSLKVVRVGDGFQGFYSADDGATWQRVGGAASATIAMPDDALAGLVAASAPPAGGGANPTVAATFSGVGFGQKPLPGAGVLTGNDELFLDDLEKRTVNWFAAVQNTTSGLFPDRANVTPGWLGGDSSVASTGFGLTALVIGSSRGWISDGYTRALRTLNFLWNDADMANPANHGYFYHFVDQTTGARSGTSELSTIDTALLMAGVLTAGQYWKGTQVETLANQLYQRVDWPFMQPDGAGTQLRMAWTPESGFSAARWDSWSEGPLLYLMAMGSQTHAINSASWFSFPRNQSVTTYAGMTFYHASGSPLFTNQYPQGWFDLRAKSDRADADPTVRVVNLDPYQNSRLHTLAQRQASIDAAAGSNPIYDHFGPNTWGLTASDSPTGYRVSGGPPINSDGTIAPTAPGGSLAFTPRQSLDALMNLKASYPNTYKTYGFVDAFNPRPGINWYDPDALGIDQGMLLTAAENLRSGLPWKLFMNTSAAQSAVSLAFTDNGTFAPPALASSSFWFETQQRVSLTFNNDVAASLDASDVQVVNQATGQIVPSGTWSLAIGTGYESTSATITFTAPLPDGRYELQVRDGGVTRSDGTTNVGPLTADFVVLAGDANRDGTVNFDDLLILARNYGSTGRTFSSGNFDYSADGLVSFSDLLILAKHYGTSLPAIGASAFLPTRASSGTRRSVAESIFSI